jgi:transposase InsO family protein
MTREEERKAKEAKEERDRQAREAKEERDRAEREREKERERKYREEREVREERERKEERELRSRELKDWKEIMENKLDVKPTTVEHETSFHVQLPYLTDSDDVDRYLDHFERVAECQKWKRETWALRLSVLLTGKAREAFDQLPLEETSNYDALKTALLFLFQSTPDTYRSKFRSVRKAGNETFPQFVHRLTELLKRWVCLAGKKEEFKDLCDLIVQEQLLSSVTDDLALFIRERSPKTATEAAECAQRFVEARRAQKTTSKDQKRFDKTKKTTGNDVKGANSTWTSTAPKSVGPKTGCFTCGGPHYQSDCPKKDQTKPKTKVAASVAQVVGVAVGSLVSSPEMTTKCSTATVAGRDAVALRDTGATTLMVSSDIVPADAKEVGVAKVTGVEAHMTVSRPIVIIDVSTPFFKGKVKAVVLIRPAYPVIIGNRVDFENGESFVVPVVAEEMCAAVETRAQARKEAEKSCQLPVDPAPIADVTPEEFRKQQQEDQSLQSCWNHAHEKPDQSKRTSQYVTKNGLLYRHYRKGEEEYHQLVVPSKLRLAVLHMGHDQPMAGHLGCRRTLERIWQTFYWPGIAGDVRRYCRSCDICQRTVPKGRVRKVYLGRVPLVSEPFSKVAIDIVGPIIPLSQSKNRYILVIVDYATRYPEAVPLKNIDSETVAEALWMVWTRVGVPAEVLTDRGTQFTSETMKQVHRLLGTKGITTTPYHAQANGLVERFNATLKTMLKRLCAERPKDWDRYIPAALFAYREVPQESSGYAPFELLYGRKVRGPAAILKQAWTAEDPMVDQDTRTVAQYVVDLRDRIEKTCLEAQKNLSKAAEKYAGYFNKKAVERVFEPGSEVLLLLPEKHNKLQVAWRGPYQVLERIGDWDYRILIRGKSKTFHANLLKQYVKREDANVAHVVADQGEPEEVPLHPQGGIPLIPLQAEEDVKDVRFAQDLPADSQEEIRKLCEDYFIIFTDLPLHSTKGECEVVVETDVPVRVTQYPLPHSQEETVKQEVEQMLRMGVIEPASSPYSSPIVLVKKKDGKIRFCVDFRRLNKVVRFDGEPLPDIDAIFARLGSAKFFSKLDLSKGYWQIPMNPMDKPKTAFTTPLGQFQWTVMPFGLKTAGAVFSRVMRRILEPLQNPDIHNFMDDVLVASETWKAHLASLRQVFKRLKEVNMSARPTKCLLGASQTSFLGHQVGDGKLWPETDKVEKIRDAERPGTKKQLRAFLGLAGYYRKFVPGYAQTALPLTDRTKAKQPEKVSWDNAAEKAFKELKTALTCFPVLILPDQKKPFVLRTDASGTGMGAVLMQDHGQGLQPVAYASKKFSGAEKNYHTIEQECFAVVWGIRKFYPFLYGRHFTVESDHHPLKYIERIRPVSRRLMGWALELQTHAFDVRTIPGKENVGADYLSRLDNL